MTAGSTYTPIATTTLGSAASSYTFSSIPSTYTDLVVIINGGTSIAGNSIYMQFNGDTGSNYSTTDLIGNGSAASSGRTTSSTFMRVLGRGIGTDSTVIDNSITHVQNYSNSTTYKTILNRSNESGGTSATAGLWRSTALIYSITLGAESSNLIVGTTLTLYGIAAA